MAAVSAGDRDQWLSQYSDDAVLYDPVGGSPLDPEGSGLRGRAALEQFWDLMVAPSTVDFSIDAIHTGANEAAVVASVSMTLAAGQRTAYDGVFLYTVDADGRIASMRAYFDLERVLATLAA